jgi:ferredoxin--NADP+ reductase
VDGPEFDAHGVDFQNLINRNKTYASIEQNSLKEYEHKCQLDKQAEKLI